MRDIEDLTEEFLTELQSNPALSAEEFSARYSDSDGELLEMLSVVEMLNKKGDEVGGGSGFLPKRLNDFIIGEKLGQGGMGLVYQAEQESLGRQVAIKILAPFLASESGRQSDFAQEAQIVANLHHPNIVQIYGSGFDHDMHYFVMELIKGSSLNTKEPHSELEVASIALQCARALEYAHSMLIIHRDIKPGNILIDALGKTHLSDFGLATILQRKESLTLSGASHEGTLRYMAPEIFLDNRYSYASDQYALGVTLFEYWRGENIITGSSSGKIIRDICENRLPKLDDKNSDLAVIIDKCMNFDAAERYENMGQVVEDIEAFIASKPIKARRNSVWRKFCLWTKRNKLVATLSFGVVGAVLALLILLSVGFVVVSNSLKREALQRKQAQENALIAKQTLERIYRKNFDNSESRLLLPPSEEAVTTLREILPYYERLNEILGDDTHEITEIRRDLAQLAMRSGQYRFAEQLFSSATSGYEEGSYEWAFCQNRRGLALLEIESVVKARKLWLSVKNSCINSSSDLARLEAVVAIKNMIRLDTEKNRKLFAISLGREAMKVLSSILRDAPNSAECRFLSASILNDVPSFAKLYSPTESSFDILKSLVELYPQNVEYKNELVRAINRLPKDSSSSYEERIVYGANLAQKLLSTSSIDPIIMGDATELFKKYMAVVGNRVNALRFRNKIIATVSSFAMNQQHFLKTRSQAISYLIDLYNTYPRAGRKMIENSGTAELLAEIEELLATYDGSDKRELQLRLNKAYSELKK